MNPKRVVGALLLSLLLCGCERKQPELGEPLANLTPEQRAQFQEGKTVFQRVFVPEDGLGPLFNSVSCAECHEHPVLGGAGDEVEVHATRFVAPDDCDPLFQEGGPVIQQDATPLLRARGIEKEQIPASATQQARRSTPPLFGFGLVDAIPQATILSHEDPDDANRDGIFGRANRAIDGRVGRFGRKAAVATLFDFNAGAFPDEQGVTTPLSPVENTIDGKPLPPETDPAPDPEITVEDIEKVTAFTNFLAPPPPQRFKKREDRTLAKRGQKLFIELKCAVCHVPEMKTGPSPIKPLNRKTVALYSDLLLHDMGPDLADICLNLAHPSEFRTELLMGLRVREQFLHDGSAATVREAIERHGGEASRSRDGFKALSDKDKEALLKFLQSI
ncbi:MAG TPA: di-heme oxidoredictase family protein [Tepidisphaeraceae bacterium]|nr:di-heme oxidoredictase family protein [Tepidisphaeraceae bacterium]